MVGKFLINPFAVVFTALALNADPLLIQVALNFEALPTDVATTRSKKMQGDQPLMAAIITMQTLLSFIMLLLTLLLGRVAFCVN
jgi:malonate transporter